jgi:hypothetical protein
MVMPAVMADSCPQCGADVRASGTRCKSCGFYLPARPAPRTGPPMARPVPVKDDSRRTAIAVLAVGGVVVLALLAVGVFIALRQPSALPSTAPVAAALPALPSAAPARLEPSALLASARREALAWHADAVLLALRFDHLDARGVGSDGSVQITYGKPSAQKITGGAEAKSERLRLTSNGGPLARSEEQGAKARVVPEPNCLFEDAWSAAQRAGADANAGLSLRYAWSEKHERPIWEVSSASGEVLKRLDGVSCSILTR